MEKDGVFIPSSIDRKAPVVFCWDNNDLTKETPGAGMTHSTNGIFIQRKASVAVMPVEASHIGGKSLQLH